MSAPFSYVTLADLALTAVGFPVRPATLATKATRGGGPAFRLFGKKPLYRWGDALDWARSRLSAPRRSTSEKLPPMAGSVA
jgi:hypothetical protein